MIIARRAVMALLVLVVSHAASAGDASYCAKGVATARVGDYDSAVANFTTCLDRATMAPDVRAYMYEARAEAYLGLNRPGEAIADFDQAIELQPSHPYFHVDRALANSWLSYPAKARRDLERGLLLASPEIAHDLINKACWSLGLLGRTALALSYCKRAIEHYPAPMGHEGLAFALWQLGDQESAHNELVAAYLAFPDVDLFKPEKWLEDFPTIFAQGLLTAHGYGRLGYGEPQWKTEAAVRAFQADNELVVDGQVSKNLLAALKAARPY